MMNWIVYSILGSISLILLNTLCKLWEPSLSTVVIIATISVITTFLFWAAFIFSEHFIVCWFTNSLFVALGAFIVNEMVFQHPLKIWNLIGVGAIIIGGVLLRI